jgi:hypothetical protein
VLSLNAHCLHSFGNFLLKVDTVLETLYREVVFAKKIGSVFAIQVVSMDYTPQMGFGR